MSDAGGLEQSQVPEGLPAAYWDDAAGEPRYRDIGRDLAEIGALREFKTAADARTAALPKTAEDYKAELPQGFQVPAGHTFQPDAKDPALLAFRSFAKEKGYDQQQFSDALGFYGQMKFNEEKAQAEASKALELDQTKQLGENATARRDAARNWMAANLSRPQAHVLETLLTYKIGVETVEALMRVAKAAPVPPSRPAGDYQKMLNAMYPSMAGKKAV